MKAATSSFPSLSNKPLVKLAGSEITCPYCWQVVSVTIDTSVPRQTYIEDCQVCCNPIEIQVESDRVSGEVVSISADKAQ